MFAPVETKSGTAALAGAAEALLPGEERLRIPQGRRRRDVAPVAERIARAEMVHLPAIVRA